MEQKSIFCDVLKSARVFRREIEALELPEWSSHHYQSSQYHRALCCFRDIFAFLSGDDQRSFFNDVIPEDIAVQLKYGQAMASLATVYNEMDGRTRRPILVALKHSRDSGINLPELQRLGFMIREEHYNRCDKDVFRDELSGHRKTVEVPLKAKVDDLCFKSSAPMNRGILAGKPRSHSAPRRLESTYQELYQKFEDNDQISFSTFRRYCSGDYLSYSRGTDCCDFCVQGRQCQKKLEQLRRLNDELDTPIPEIISKYADRPTSAIFQAASCILEVNEHREHKHAQRLVYHRHTNELRPHEITIECDWRRKGHLPLSEQDTGNSFYNHTQYALFGVAFYWCDAQGVTQHHSVDCLSNSITEDSHCSLEGMRTAVRTVLHNPAVPLDLLGATKIHFWSDTGPHFRCYEYIHYCLIEFLAKLGTQARVDVNFLTEKHGKNQRDTHFRAVRSYTMRAARESKTVIQTVSELRKALISAHCSIQSMNKREKLPLQSAEFYLLNLNVAGTYRKKQMVVSDLASVYALRMEDGLLYAYKNSTYTSRVLMAYSCTDVLTEYALVVPPTHPIPTAPSVTKLLKKRRLNKLKLYIGAEDCEGSEPE